MAIVITSFQEQNAASLEAAINAYMAAHVGVLVHGVWITATEDARTLGRTYRAIITTEAGGAAGAAWVISLFEGQNASDIGDPAAAIVLAAGGSFYPAVRIDSWYFDGGSLSARCFGWLMSNTDAVNAAADWTPL